MILDKLIVISWVVLPDAMRHHPKVGIRPEHLRLFV